MQESKAKTFGGTRENLGETEALAVVLDHMYWIHSKTRPKHADQKRILGLWIAN